MVYEADMERAKSQAHARHSPEGTVARALHYARKQILRAWET